MKWFKENLETLSIVGILFVMIFAAVRFMPSRPTLTYADKLFDSTRVHRIDIDFSFQDEATYTQAPTARSKYPTSVTVDGERYDNVSVSTHGNASLYREDIKENLRYSFKLKFDRYDERQTYYGLDELVLNNLSADPSSLRDWLALEIMRHSGVATPLTAYTEVYINGKLKGLYLAVEDYGKSFMRRNHIPLETALYKPEALGHDNSRMSLMQDFLGENEQLSVVTSVDDADFDYEGTDLIYRGDDPALYAGILENAITKTSPQSRKFLIDSLRSLVPADERRVEELRITASLDPEEYWNIDALIDYFAAHNFILNFDSYTGRITHNYILVSAPHGSTFLPWDYNLAFHELWMEVNGEEAIGLQHVVEWDIDELLFTDDTSKRPVWALIVDNPDYLARYHAKLQTLLYEYLADGTADAQLYATAELIRPYLQADPTKFFTIEEFDEGVEYLRNFVYYRSDSIQQQLWEIDHL